MTRDATENVASRRGRWSVMGTWVEGQPGVVQLPSGRLVRGRALRGPRPDVGLPPELGVYLLGKEPPPVRWDGRWVRWPDFRLPSDRAFFDRCLLEALERCAQERVEFGCSGGRGRTGTALACLAIADGLPSGEAVAFVRSRYSAKAVETPWQKRFVERFPSSTAG